MIRDLAFQSQFLALHAAYEAARSGSSGRSLAMIATEVRRLTQYCGHTAAAIKGLLDEGPAPIDLAHIAHADLVLQHLMAAIARVHDLIAVVSSATREDRTRQHARAQATAPNERHIILIAQLASTTRTLEARCKLINKAIAALRFQAEASTLPLTGTGPDALSSTGTQTGGPL